MPAQTDSPALADAAFAAGQRRINLGRAPHYATPYRLTCYACPIDDCDWHHDDRHDTPTPPAALETAVRDHLGGHTLTDFLSTIAAAHAATREVKEANDRAWDVVKVMRLRAAHRGEDPYSDPFAQLLSAALVADEPHEPVRQEIAALEGGAGA